MSIKKLGNAVQSRLSAAATINSYTRAVEELVYNSLDSDSTSIAIRIDIHESFIQVIDNGCGISKNDIHLLGQRYTTSKAIDQSERPGISGPSKYGFRGESLANIIEVSNDVKITSRYEESDDTWIKYFFKSRHRDTYMTTMRPSKGTTVEIKGFLYNLHIKKKETNNMTEIQRIKEFLQQVSLERTNISMSFRDNSRNEIVFTVHKNRDVYQTLSSLFDIDKKDIQELQVEKNRYKIIGFVGKNETSHDYIKWIYFNGRYVRKSAIHDIINGIFMKNQAHNRKRSMKKALQDGEINVREIPYYFLFISCPHADYDISFNPEKTFIQFRDWTQIKLLIEKFVQFFNGNVKLKDIRVIKDKKMVGSTQEEARKIVDKILGNKNKIQMDKGVIGKTVRKKIKQQNNNYNLQKKICVGESNKNHKSKESSIAEASNLQHNFNSYNKINNNRIKNMHKLTHIKRISEKMKMSKVKKDKCSPNSDPMIKKFIDPTDSVKQRCDIYSENIKELLHKKTKLAREHAKNANIKDDRIKLKNNVQEAVHKNKENYSLVYSEAQVTKDNSIKTSAIVPLGKTNKEYLRSYDLVETILNSQNDVCCNTNSDVLRQSTNSDYRYIKQNEYSSNIIVPNAKSNDTSPFTDLTFDSHRYLNHHNFVSKINDKPKTKDNLYKFSVRKEITQSVRNTKFKHRMLQNYLIRKNYEGNRTENIHKVFSSKLDDILNIAAQKSYDIDINYNNKPDFIETQNKYSHDRWNFKVTGNIQSTYTIIDASVTLNFENHINHKSTISECYEKSIAIEKEKIFETSSHLGDKESMRDRTYDLYSHQMNKECDSKMIFTSYSENGDSQMMTNCNIEPLNVCEAVYNNHYGENSHLDIISTLSTTSRGGKNICPKSRGTLETNNKVADNDMLRHDLDEKSHHFQNVTNSILYSSIVQSQVNNKSEKISKEEIEINSKVNKSNEKYSIESLDVYFKTTPNWTDVIVRNQENNNFIIQNRHNFLPKGMSQIFENCNSKKVCSYDLEMDYFKDELYNDFANNVLDNFNLFERRIQNVKDNVPENFTHLNKKLKTDSTNLKFNTYSLKSAKVFGQVDNKYIAAELHRDNDKSLKYLVLFDQHAVHERITLEENLSDYIKNDQWISVDCKIPAIKLNKENMVYLNNYKDKFMQLGLKWKFENDLVLINGIPEAVLGKHFRQPDVILTCMKKFIIEEINAIKTLKGNSLLYPKTIMELVFSEACRYAIKFGDVLTKEKCAMLIETLSTCKTPFQCAHGRPVMAVLLDMKTIDNEYMVASCKIHLDCSVAPPISKVWRPFSMYGDYSPSVYAPWFYI